MTKSFKETLATKTFKLPYWCSNNGDGSVSVQFEKWMGKSIPLEVDHINGKKYDNRLENLRIICPNCHAQTPTYKSKNIKYQKLMGQ